MQIKNIHTHYIRVRVGYAHMHVACIYIYIYMHAYRSIDGITSRSIINIMTGSCGNPLKSTGLLQRWIAGL